MLGNYSSGKNNNLSRQNLGHYPPEIINQRSEQMLGTRFGAMASSLVTATGNFKTVSYTGTGSMQNITSIPFQPDLVLIFNTAGNASGTWPAFDSTNGPTNYADWANNSANHGTDSNSLTSFNSNGFTISSSSLVNNNGTTYQAFCWKKAANFFDIETYTGNATARTIAHNLTSVPQMINISATVLGMVIGSANLTASSPYGSYGYFGNTSISVSANVNMWNNTAPNSSVFSVGISAAVNNNSAPYTAYLWGTGAGKSAFGTYTGNGSSTGPSVTGLGFMPSCVMILLQSPTSSNLRVVYGNNASGALNLDSAASSTNFINLVSGGFNVVTTNADFNTNGAVYQYMAWA